MAKENDFGMSDAEIKNLIAKEQLRKQKMLRDRLRWKLLIAKAKEAGITVTSAEIDAEIARMAQK